MDIETEELVEKEKKIKKEISRLNKILKEVDSKKKGTAEGLIKEAAFMRVTLEELKDQINREGAIDQMQQGDYFILREHPAVKIYTTMVQRYTAVFEKLSGLLPKEIPKEEDDGFDDFIKRRE